MDDRSQVSLRSRSSLVGGVSVGLLHAVFAVFLWGSVGLDNLGELVVLKPLIGLYILLGMFALGFVPAVFYVGQRTISPACVVGGLLLLSVVGSWLAGPVRAPAGTPTPFGMYILLWVGIVALAGLLGRVEHRWNQPSST